MYLIIIIITIIIIIIIIIIITIIIIIIIFVIIIILFYIFTISRDGSIPGLNPISGLFLGTDLQLMVPGGRPPTKHLKLHKNYTLLHVRRNKLSENSLSLLP